MKTRERWIEEARLWIEEAKNANLFPLGYHAVREALRDELEQNYLDPEVRSAIDDEGGISEYFDTLWDYITEEEVRWYAVVEGRDDDDWGTGSWDLDEAEEMARKRGPEAYIVIVDDLNGVSIGEIRQDEF